MPSRYVLKKIEETSQDKSFGELLLFLNISIMDKHWNQIHPAHLKIILTSIKNSFTDGTFENIVLEILEESKII